MQHEKRNRVRNEINFKNQYIKSEKEKLLKIKRLHDHEKRQIKHMYNESIKIKRLNMENEKLKLLREKKIKRGIIEKKTKA